MQNNGHSLHKTMDQFQTACDQLIFIYHKTMDQSQHAVIT